MKLTLLSAAFLALTIVTAPARASLVGQSVTMTTSKTGTVTISPLGSTAPVTVVASNPEFGICVGPSANTCITSGMSGSVNIEASTISFSFSGSTNAATGTFTVILSGFTQNIASVTYNSGSLISGTFALESFTSNSITFAGSVTDGFFSAINGRTISFDVAVKPVVTQNPTSTTVCEGSTATFTAAASGSPTPTVQWQFSTDGGATFNNVPAATSTTLSFTAAASQNGNQYKAVFTNASGSAATTAATLTVNTAPHVTLNPAFQSVKAGQTATFTAAASGAPTPTVQWQVSTNGGGTFNNIPGATSTTLSFVVGLADQGNQYRAVFTNGCGTDTTAAALLSANQGAYLIRYSSNLTAGDSVINITNTGANGAALYGPGFGGAAGNICVNVYAFSPDEQLVSCCSCLVTPNGLVHMTANNDLVSNTLTGIRPSSIVIKMVATSTAVDSKTAPFAGSSCTNSAALAGTATFPLADGALAWGTTLHTDSNVDPPPAGSVFSITETPFLSSTLRSDELASVANRCTNIIGNGSTFGVCRSCRLGGLGGDKQ